MGHFASRAVNPRGVVLARDVAYGHSGPVIIISPGYCPRITRGLRETAVSANLWVSLRIDAYVICIPDTCKMSLRLVYKRM